MGFRELPFSETKQPGRSDKQRDEEPIQPQILRHGAITGMLRPGDARDHGDQRLSERRREQRAWHSMWLEARDDGTDDSDGEHPIRFTRTPAGRRSRPSLPTRRRPAGNPPATA